MDDISQEPNEQPPAVDDDVLTSDDTGEPLTDDVTGEPITADEPARKE